MISIDTNLLLYALNRDCAENEAAAALLAECGRRDDVAICELVLVEFYQLLGNPAVVTNPLGARAAADVCRQLRRNPRWALVENAPVMDRVRDLAGRAGFARRRLFDARLAFTLQHHGVRRLATRDVRDFDGLGFEVVWDPLSDDRSLR